MSVAVHASRHCNQQLFPSQIADKKSGLEHEQNYSLFRPISEGLQPESGGNDQVISKKDECEVKLKTIATKIVKDAFAHALSDPRRGNKCVIAIFVVL